MPKKGHTEEQIIAALKQYEGGEKAPDIWRKQYAGLGVQELRELRQLRDENERLKRRCVDRLEMTQRISSPILAGARP